jgi:hypothetical protein
MILIFKGLTARHLYKSFGVKGLKHKETYGGEKNLCDCGNGIPFTVFLAPSHYGDQGLSPFAIKITPTTMRNTN